MAISRVFSALALVAIGCGGGGDQTSAPLGASTDARQDTPSADAADAVGEAAISNDVAINDANVDAQQLSEADAAVDDVVVEAALEASVGDAVVEVDAAVADAVAEVALEAAVDDVVAEADAAVDDVVAEAALEAALEAGVCTPGSEQCIGTVLQICDATGQWQLTQTCPYVCSMGACTGICVPGTYQCTGSTRQLCSSTGSWQTSTACPFACLNNACTDCQPGSVGCSGLVAQQCSPTTGKWVPVQNCPYVCSGGACLGVCTPGATQCSGQTAQICATQGQWQTIATCPFMCTGGICSCVPGTRQCSGTSIKACDAQGVWQLESVCPFVCGSGPACIGECTPGSTKCSGTSIQTCSATGFWDVVACPALALYQVPVCTNGACSVACADGYADCNGFAGDGCETDLSMNSTHCGSCDRDCLDSFCWGGVCAGHIVVTRIAIPGYLAVDQQNLYWTELGFGGENIVQIPKGVSQTAVILASNQPSAFWLSLQNSNLYWSTTVNISGKDYGSVLRMPLPITTAPVTILTLAPDLGGIANPLATDETYVFFMGTSGVTKALIPEGTPVQLGSAQAGGILPVGSYVYWSESNKNRIMRAPIVSGVAEVFATGQANPMGLAACGGKLFWANSGPGLNGSIVAVDLSSGVPIVIASGVSSPMQVACDATSVYWESSGSNGNLWRAPATGGTPVSLTTCPHVPHANIVVDDKFIYWTEASSSVNGSGYVYKVAK